MAGQEGASGIDAEFEGAELGDRRRQRRLVHLVRALDEKPGASYPDVTVTDAGLEGAYRLLSNDAVSADAILAGHYQQTAERAAAEGWVIAVHDTTIFEFSGEKEREGLGPLRGKGQGFLGHFGLVVAPGELRRPLGVVALQSIVREQRRGQAKPRLPAGESTRWVRGVELVEQRLEHSAVIHVMDREADSYDLWSAMIQAGRRFVIRSRWDRQLAEAGEQRVSDAVANAVTVVERMVALAPRRQEKIVFNTKRRPVRAGRLPRLALSAIPVVLKRSTTAGSADARAQHRPRARDRNSRRKPASGVDTRDDRADRDGRRH
jgi:hypothetical protein